MMLKLLSLAFAVMFLSFSWAQDKLLMPKIDSISLDYRSSGYSIDSVDAAFGLGENLRPAGFDLPELNMNQLLNQPDALGSNFAGFNYLQRSACSKFLVSPLPYIGFQYSFGKANTQNLDVHYAHAFSKHTLLNVHYNKKSSDGFLRNSLYKINDVNAVLIHSKNRYSTKIDGKYSTYTWNENGGMTTDTLLAEYVINLTPVNRSSSSTRVNKADVLWENYFSINSDSLIKTGFYHASRYEIVNRVYTENNPIMVADTFFIDSTRTRDQYQTASIKNGIGYFYASPYFQINGSINQRYWRNQNLDRYFDTTELFLASDLYAGFEKFNITNKFYFNLAGATGEIKNYTRLNLSTKYFDLKGKLDFLNVYPTPYQRRNFSNNYQWNITNLETQQIIKFGGDLKFKSKVNFGAGVHSTTINNGLFFINNQWNQDSLSTISTLNTNVWLDYKWKKFHLSHKLDFNINSSNYNFQPAFISTNRIAFVTPIFKAQKLKLNVGLDVQYLSSYNSMTYLPELSLYSPIRGAENTGNYALVHAFGAIDLDTFRMFVRVENVSSLWNDLRIRVDEGYGIMPMFMRLGISWDFFN